MDFIGPSRNDQPIKYIKRILCLTLTFCKLWKLLWCLMYPKSNLGSSPVKLRLHCNCSALFLGLWSTAWSILSWREWLLQPFYHIKKLWRPISKWVLLQLYRHFERTQIFSTATLQKFKQCDYYININNSAWTFQSSLSPIVWLLIKQNKVNENEPPRPI